MKLLKQDTLVLLWTTKYYKQISVNDNLKTRQDLSSK